MRVMFYVQHLLGVGHVFRAMRIVRALCEKGLEVDLVYGGEPIPNHDAGTARVHFLPPLRAGTKEFHLLELPDGSVADETYRNRRRDMLLDLFHRTEPDTVITEAFPFGRRQMRFELLPLLDAAISREHKPVIICSVRDILQERAKPGRNEETVDHIERYFDQVLVHGDPDMVRLEETFPLAGHFADKTFYTGIVAPERSELTQPDEVFDVIVSVGGGMLGHQLLEAAARAKSLSAARDAKWLFTAGPNASEDDCSAILQMAGESARVVPFASNLTSLMKHAQLSVSRGGYNTVADLFVSGCRAIVAPLDDGKETEQLKRAEILEQRNLATILWPHEVNPETIAAKIDRTLAMPAPDRTGIDLNGARKTAELIARWLERDSLP